LEVTIIKMWEVMVLSFLVASYACLGAARGIDEWVCVQAACLPAWDICLTLGERRDQCLR